MRGMGWEQGTSVAEELHVAVCPGFALVRRWAVLVEDGASRYVRVSETVARWMVVILLFVCVCMRVFCLLLDCLLVLLVALENSRTKM